MKTQYFGAMARELWGLLILSSVLLCVVAQSLGPNRLTCGKRRVKTIHLIQNGIDAKPGHWPWHAAILHRKGDQLDYACGGSIIDENTILTAAHCVFLVNGLLPVSRIEGRWFVRGIVSFIPLRKNTALCDTSKFTAFADVAKYLKWIEQYIDSRVLVFDTDDYEVDYEEKLPLFDLKTCGIKSDTFLAEGSHMSYPWVGFAVVPRAALCVVTLVSDWYVIGPASCFENDGNE